MNMRTLGQERSEYALDRVMENLDVKELKAFSAGAPSMILKNGFGQALAFWKAKAKGKERSEHQIMFSLVRAWLLKKGFASGSTDVEFLKDISTMAQHQYLEAQKETLALLEWVKRYANAFIEKEK